MYNSLEVNMTGAHALLVETNPIFFSRICRDFLDLAIRISFGTFSFVKKEDVDVTFHH